jgi:hypothetical protein
MDAAVAASPVELERTVCVPVRDDWLAQPASSRAVRMQKETIRIEIPLEAAFGAAALAKICLWRSCAETMIACSCRCMPCCGRRVQNPFPIPLRVS